MASTESQAMSVLPTQVVVSSESDPGTTYLVQLPYCPCKDFRYRRAGLLARLAAGDVTALAELFCKHLRKGLTLVGGWHSAPEPRVHKGLSRPNAYEVLHNAGVNRTEAGRALREAATTGRSYAGLPDSSASVRHEGGVADGLFSVELPE